MKIINRGLATILIVTLQAAVAAASTIQNPKANQVINKSQLKLEVSGSCAAGAILNLVASDSANKKTAVVWTQCQPWGYWAAIDITNLKDGKIQLKINPVRNQADVAKVTIVKNTGAIVPPTPTPTPTPAPTVTPTPAPSSGIIYGVNGHDGRQYYPMNQAEARFQLLSANNLRSYRFDIDPRNFAVLDQLVPLAKKYNIILRPMVYPMTENEGYAVAKRYGADIKIWEVANEQDSSIAGAQGRINTMVAMYKGMKRASDESGFGLKFTINVMSCNYFDTSATARCPNDKAGTTWFLDMAKASGFNFDYISFHYYPRVGDKSSYMGLMLTQMRGMATKFKTKIFYNEVNCAEVYDGNTNGGSIGDRNCGDSLNQIFTILESSYSDIVAEVNVYELLDQPNHQDEEGHFGLMYDINRPKPSLKIVSDFAKKK